jgi:hypothetical protein
MIWWVPLVPWIVAPHWVAIAEQRRVKIPESVPSFRKTAFAAVLVLVVAFISPLGAWMKSRHPRSAVTALNRGTPNDIAAALMGQPLVDPKRFAELEKVVREERGGRFTGRVFSSEIQGEYLLWAFPAEVPVMMYNHTQLFTPEYWNECLRVKVADQDWWEILDRHRAEAVVVEVDLAVGLCEELRTNPNWRVAIDETGTPARDQLSRLFVAVKKSAPGVGKAP